MKLYNLSTSRDSFAELQKIQKNREWVPEPPFETKELKPSGLEKIHRKFRKNQENRPNWVTELFSEN
ncbi:MAG: hypothetical protein HQM08_24125 [Candidatus Riflebacteria bacterium]|nr:hypothetical protein [Candidatus Riflebacteria bacterium]